MPPVVEARVPTRDIIRACDHQAVIRHLESCAVGAVQQHGSICVVERFIRSMKNECTRRILVPLALEAMRRELLFYVVWFNEYRPSQALDGRTPREAYEGLRPANAEPRFEPRTTWPRRSKCASPQAEIRGRRGTRLTLVVGYLEGRQHLPVVELRRAA